MELVHKDLIPLLEVDSAISDAAELYARRGPLLYMSTPWWERTNRHLLINHLCRLYEFCVKHNLSYRDAVRFNNRTVYHMYPTGRVIVREISQSIGSVTLRAHFRNLTAQFGGTSWLDLFDLEDRFWSVQKAMHGALDPAGAMTKIGGKRSYTLWEGLDGIRRIAQEKKLPFMDLGDFVFFHAKPINTYKLASALGSCLARGSVYFQTTMPRVRSNPFFSKRPASIGAPETRPCWLDRLGLGQARLVANTLPLGFCPAREHLGSGGSSADVVEIAPSGQYKTRDGSVFSGDFWFKGARNPWLTVQIGDSNAEKVDLDSWYNPLRHDDVPKLSELQTLDPNGPWTRVWDPKTGRPISPQAGKIVLR